MKARPLTNPIMKPLLMLGMVIYLLLLGGNVFAEIYDNNAGIKWPSDTLPSVDYSLPLGNNEYNFLVTKGTTASFRPNVLSYVTVKYSANMLGSYYFLNSSEILAHYRKTNLLEDWIVFWSKHMKSSSLDGIFGNVTGAYLNHFLPDFPSGNNFAAYIYPDETYELGLGGEVNVENYNIKQYVDREQDIFANEPGSAYTVPISYGSHVRIDGKLSYLLDRDDYVAFKTDFTGQIPFVLSQFKQDVEITISSIDESFNQTVIYSVLAHDMDIIRDHIDVVKDGVYVINFHNPAHADISGVTYSFSLSGEHEDENPVNLTVRKEGDGFGTIISTPPGINCGLDCTEMIDAGTDITLKATPANGSTFIGWEGSNCMGAGDCVVNAISNTTVTARFALAETNNAPIVIISPAGTNVNVGATVSLSGSASYDPDGDSLAGYTWELYRPSTSSAALSSVNNPSTSLTPDVAGNYTVKLTVSDGVNTVSKTATISVSANYDVSPIEHPNQYILGSPSNGVSGSKNWNHVWEFVAGENTKSIYILLYGGSSTNPLGIALRKDRAPTVEQHPLSPSDYIWVRYDYKGVPDGQIREEIEVITPQPGKYYIMAYAFGNFSNAKIYYQLTESIDFDDDGVPNHLDAFPLDETEQYDSDSDGIGNNIDQFDNDAAASVDSDGDGAPDAWNSGKSASDSTTGLHLDKFINDVAASIDDDNDGAPDVWNNGMTEANSTTGLVLDQFPNNMAEWKDSDMDGVGDHSDWAPTDPAEWADDDNDHVSNNADVAPNDPNRWDNTPPVIAAIPVFSVALNESIQHEVNVSDNENDEITLSLISAYPFITLDEKILTVAPQDVEAGEYNALLEATDTYSGRSLKEITINVTAPVVDECPDDPDKTAPGACGCGVPDIDTDQDGIADCNDTCDDSVFNCGVHDISSKVEFEKSRLLYDRINKTQYVDVSLINISGGMLVAPIRVVIDTISNPNVTVANADGYTDDGKPYFEYQSLETFNPMESTEAKRWIFDNPYRARFNYTVQILGVDEKIETAPNTSAWCYPRGNLENTGSIDMVGTAQDNIFSVAYTIGESDGLLNTATNVVTGDVDGDNINDLIIINSDQVFIYYGDNNKPHAAVDLPTTSYYAILEDMTGDGILDIAVGSYQDEVNQISIVKGDGTIYKTILGQVGSAWDRYYSRIMPLTYLGNGKLAASYSSGYATNPRGYAVFDINAGENGLEDWYYDIGPIPGTTAVVDVNHDGLYEFLSSVFTPHNGGTGSSGTPTTDGDLYLIMVNENGQEVFTNRLGNDTSGGANGGNINIITDLDGDENPEIVSSIGHYSSYPGAAEIRVMDASNGAEKYRVGTGYNAGSNIFVADIDMDGNKEVIFSHRTNGTIQVFDPTLTLLDSTASSGYVRSIADIDGDGYKDILVSDNNTIRCLDGHTLTEEWQLSLAGTISNIIPSNIDADGYAEVIVIENGSVTVLEGPEL